MVSCLLSKEHMTQIGPKYYIPGTINLTFRYSDRYSMDKTAEFVINNRYITFTFAADAIEWDLSHEIEAISSSYSFSGK